MNEVPSLWITVFEEDSAILVSAKDGDIRLPTLVAPFKIGEVKVACAGQGIVARVIQSMPGPRDSVQLKRIRLARKAEQASKEKLLTSALKSSVVPAVRSWAEALDKKNAIDDELRRRKAELGVAKSRVYQNGQYADPSWFRGTEARIESLKIESQALQVKIGELRRKEQQCKRARDHEIAHAFLRAAKEYLESDEWESLMAAAEESVDADEAKAELLAAGATK